MARKRNKSRTLNVSSGNNIENIEGSRSVTDTESQENRLSQTYLETENTLAAGQPLPKKRRTDTSRTPQSTVSVCLTNAKPNTSFSTFSSKDSRQTTETIYKQTYGLLGEGSGSAFADVNLQNKTNYFEVLPIDLIEHIFCQLPILDLCLNSNRVCQQWNDIISDRKFVPWKKKYHMLKKGYGNTLTEIKGIMASAGMSLPSMYLKGLIRHMKDFKPVTASNMTKCLKAHPKYGWATALIRERIPECIKREGLGNETLADMLALVLAILAQKADLVEIAQVAAEAVSRVNRDSGRARDKPDYAAVRHRTEMKDNLQSLRSE
ncbi:F-box DNA helicase 1-like, partial [Haliotis rubra]|uniref:F-box DNA helicase 1-like n=1 Tax=Haliotis rubra TaxID=36100 RepID=UPI001EE59F40